jgi:hypothetical protein
MGRLSHAAGRWLLLERRLADNSLVEDDASSRFLTAHPDPGLP